MLFADVRNALVTELRARVRNGELTERGLARIVGVSQPHIHNVLKGVRALSPELSDQILQHLRLSLLDLIEREQMEAHLSFVLDGEYVYVPLLEGRIGPGFPWPTRVVESNRLPFPSNPAASIANPVAVRLGEDSRMSPAFTAGDVALLDQSPRARSQIEHGAFYIVKSASGGIVRRLETKGSEVYLVAEDSNRHPSGWQAVHLKGKPLTHLVRARAHIIHPACEWI